MYNIKYYTVYQYSIFGWNWQVVADSGVIMCLCDSKEKAEAIRTSLEYLMESCI